MLNKLICSIFILGVISTPVIASNRYLIVGDNENYNMKIDKVALKSVQIVHPNLFQIGKVIINQGGTLYYLNYYNNQDCQNTYATIMKWWKEK